MASIEYVDRMGATSSVYTQGFCDGAIAVVNANFFVEANNRKHPLGLLKINGRSISRTSPRKSGGFLVIDDEGGVIVLPRSQEPQAEATRDVIQSTPVLVLNGHDDMRRDQRDLFDRVAVGNTQSGAIVIVGAFAQDQETISLAEFSLLALTAAALKGIELDGLLGMDGGPSAHIWFPKDGALYGHRGPVYLPSVVCVTPR
ncbi:MAG: phosphodiester glycosidase family protein [Pigmentiphaga sp.]